MRGRFRPPAFVIAIGLLALLVLLATLQYRWLGRISEAEREQLRARLSGRATEFAHDFDRELTRAYLLFQPEGPQPEPDEDLAFGQRYDRWQATSAFPRMLREFYMARRDRGGALMLERFDLATRTLQPAAWPPSMADWRSRLDDRGERVQPGDPSLVVRRLPAPVWETVPALVVPAPVLFVSEDGDARRFRPPDFSYTVLAIDLDYVRREMLPALAARHFRDPKQAPDYQVAVIDRGPAASVVYQSTPSFTPRSSERGDAGAPLFQVRVQDFASVAAEVRRFAMFSTNTMRPGGGEHRIGRGGRRQAERPTQMSIVVKQGVTTAGAEREGLAASRAAASAPRWQLVVKHPSGSLEAFVETTRRRNLIVSTIIQAVLAASIALLVFSARRSQELARTQLEFVAAVSHELRTPLAVIRSAGDNLADGVVNDAAQVQKYGQVIRAEGRRLSEMVEQILELAGIQSGQRGFAMQPVSVPHVIDEVLSASQPLIDQERIRVDVEIPADLPAVTGDEAALRRVFQNLVGNAIKYGAEGRWIGVTARSSGAHVTVTIRDRGIGIAPAEQARIFEPFYRAADVVAARIQGAGLGLSLVQRIVEAHGGRIDVSSAPGTGSEFSVVLPIAAGEADARVRAAPSAEAASSS
jgi:signal transduction histidine kinase